MTEKKPGSIEIGSSPEDYSKAYEFIDDLLKRNRITHTVSDEVKRVFEALYHNIQEQTGGRASLRITGQKSLGDTKIRLGYFGKPFVLTEEVGDIISPEARILNAYADKIDCSYHSGHNNISISVKRSPGRAILLCIIAMVLAGIAYLAIHFCAGLKAEAYISERIIWPFEVMFARAMLLVAGPVTFFSLLKNLTDTYIFSSTVSDTRKVQGKTIITSVISVILALLISVPIGLYFKGLFPILKDFKIAEMEMASLEDLVSDIVPTDILSLFEGVSPFPMIIIAVITTYAFCSSGKYFDMMKEATDVCYSLFSSMLSLVMYTLPVFAFISFLDMLLFTGPKMLLYVVYFTMIVLVSLLAMAGFYTIRLKLGGVAADPFYRKLGGLIYENIKINSAIDAVPFNVRYCMRTYKIDRKRLEDTLPVLAQINLDGNCFVITMISVLILLLSDTPFSVMNIASMAVLVLFLSLGAPNQPGSVLVGLLIILNYLSLTDLIPLAIYCEVMFGSLLNIINVTGDIVTVAVLDNQEKSLDAKSV